MIRLPANYVSPERPRSSQQISLDDLAAEIEAVLTDSELDHPEYSPGRPGSAAVYTECSRMLASNPSYRSLRILARYPAKPAVLPVESTPA